jgi:membrane dipeptidase
MSLALALSAAAASVASSASALCSVSALFPAPPAGFQLAAEPAPDSTDPLELHFRSIVVDTHADTTQRIVYQGAHFLEGIPSAQLDYPKMKLGGIDAQFMSIFVYPKRTPAASYFSESMRQIAAIRGLVDASGGRLALARTAADVRDNAARGVSSLLLGVEGGHALGVGSKAEQLGHLRELAAQGVRYLTLTWATSNDIGGSSGDAGDGDGLTSHGRNVLALMQRLGVMVDLSHVSDSLFWDAIHFVKKPVILSHSSSRSLANVPRNVTDAMLRAVARNGGAVCANYNPSFLDSDFARAQAPIWARFRDLPVDESWRSVQEASLQLPQVALSRLVDHIVHMVAVAGADHVCLGSDFDGIPVTPAGLPDASHLPELTIALKKRGMSAWEIQRILGLNTLRVLEANEPR